MECFGNILASASYLIGEIILINGNEVSLQSDVVNVRNYLQSKWLNSSVISSVPVIPPNVTSDISITATWLPQTTTATKDLKIVIQHTRTSPSQTIQYKLTASGPGVNNGAKNTVFGSLTRYDGTTPIQDNPIIANHNLIDYTDSQLVGPFTVPSFWLELLDYGLVFTSRSSNTDSTVILLSYPTGVDPANPKVQFSQTTLSITPIGSVLSVPASVTISLS